LINSKKDNEYVLEQKEVAIGNSFNGYTEIKNTTDFTESDQFLTKGAFNLIRADE
jgi:hypothetical protein